MFAKTEEINTIKMEFNMGRFTGVFRSSSNITLQYDIMPGFLIREWIGAMWKHVYERDQLLCQVWEYWSIFFLVTVDDPSQINLSSHNVHCVAGVLKKYLRELPNPVIPVEMYQPFIQAASEWPS